MLVLNFRVKGCRYHEEINLLLTFHESLYFAHLIFEHTIQVNIHKYHGTITIPKQQRYNVKLKLTLEMFEDTKGVIRSRNSKWEQTAQWPKGTEQKDKYDQQTTAQKSKG